MSFLHKILISKLTFNELKLSIIAPSLWYHPKMFLYTFILNTISIVSVYTINNIQATNGTLSCLKSDDSNNDSTIANKIWRSWDMIKGARIIKDYVAYEPPKMDSAIFLYAGDCNSSLLNINERKKKFEISLVLELTWADNRIKVDFSALNDRRRLPSIKKNIQPYIWTPDFEIVNMKELKYLHDPDILNHVHIISGKSTDRRFSDNTYKTMAMFLHRKLFHPYETFHLDFVQKEFDKCTSK